RREPDRVCHAVDERRVRGTQVPVADPAVPRADILRALPAASAGVRAHARADPRQPARYWDRAANRGYGRGAGCRARARDAVVALLREPIAPARPSVALSHGVAALEIGIASCR